ncbi:MAG: hypothetical protein IPH05_09400 [Flavobacteriales bacterium]|jgi:hypothetical protein|nr:hypothetical protein [Flavobacteriales bacterium]MBK6552103.1 hypothetical protein [Flavobacteriales bacterium]MBK6883140.1 hypothetical protein [Flavobacteriales bacterium]MBK7103178.1 hypothetical protein [Flavobacteriales bacterium]MBK7112847.1 hypothetical protein [Flavobacteriales bacterium]
MKQTEKNLPLSTVTLIFGALSIPLAFARHLVSLALVLAILALIFGFWGMRKSMRQQGHYKAFGIARMKLGFRMAIAGAFCSLVMWFLWASNMLF